MALKKPEMCPKCGGKDRAIEWHKDQYDCVEDHCTRIGDECGEHLHYTCRTCGYEWVGPTAENCAIDGVSFCPKRGD